MNSALGSIHEEIKRGDYECLICFNSITPRSAVWNCRSCFRVYDLKCIKEWGNRSTEIRGQWNCPHCLTPQVQKAHNSQYRCWCGKQRKNPSRKTDFNTSQLDAPHSCGQSCGAKRECMHPCPLVCHAGSHAKSSECFYMGPKISCYCGKQNEQVICSQTRYGGFACDSQCNKTNRVCKHKCSQRCHDKADKLDCGPCAEEIQVSCFCGELSNELRLCSSLSRSQRAKLRGRKKGKISCDNVCGTSLSCGIHHCTSRCHSSSTVKHDCPFAPTENEKCFCGKSAIHREVCTEPRTSCGNVCNKAMPCGHMCTNICHDGLCPPCVEIVSGIRCRCKATAHETICGSRETLTCNKKCDASSSCKRHRCRKECCEFSSRTTSKIPIRPSRQLNISLEDLLSGVMNIGDSFNTSRDSSNEAAEAAHFCSRICGRLLSCGSHTCPKLCHAGKCGPCLSTSFDEWICPCGSTIVEPPIRCGTVMPQCRSLCHRPQLCGHRSHHLCHPSSEPCAPCPVLIEVPCRCGKSLVKEKCYQLQNKNEGSVKSCTMVCGKILKCGHKCKKLCCPENEECPSCQEVCDHTYSCGHTHGSLCHFPLECPEQCHKDLVTTCPCGFLKCDYECGEDAEVGCTEECWRECYPRVLLEAYEQEKRWFLNVEFQIRDFVKNQTNKTLWFKPMSKKHRRFVYLMLEHYGLEGESVDAGENRSVRGILKGTPYLCRTSSQKAGHTEPYLFADQIRQGPKSSLCGVDSSPAALEKSPLDDGFRTVLSKAPSQDIKLRESAQATQNKFHMSLQNFS